MSKVVTRSWRVSQQCERQTHLPSTSRNRPSTFFQPRRSINSYSNGVLSRPILAAQQHHYSSPHQSPRSRWLSRSSSHNAFLHPSIFSQTKSFSTTTTARVAGGSNRIASRSKGKVGKAFSLQKSEGMQKLISSGNIPDDMGLMEGTFVPPTGSKRPGWLKAPRARFQLVRRHRAMQFLDFWRTMYFRWFGVKPRPKINRSQVSKTAAGLYSEMYDHFAGGDLETIRDKLCGGLFNNLRSRIEDRESMGPQRWTLHKHISKPKLVSYKAMLMPMSQDQQKSDKYNAYGLVQAVVRMRTLQSLHHLKRIPVQPSAKNNYEITREILIDPASGKEIPPDRTSDNAKEVVEYVVVQQQLLKSKLQEWKIWGMTNETTLEDLLKVEADKAAAEKRMRAKMAPTA